MVVTRVILVWAALSLAAGAAVLYVEVGRVSQRALVLAADETERFIEYIEAIGPEHLGALDKQAKELFKGDYISLRFYGTD